METIAVTRVQAAALLAAAKKRAQRTRVSGGASAYMKRVKGNVPNVTNTGTSCARHLLVRVVRGLRGRAGITHKSRGKVIFKPGTKLARKHPRGVACYAPPTLAPAAFPRDLAYLNQKRISADAKYTAARNKAQEAQAGVRDSEFYRGELERVGRANPQLYGHTAARLREGLPEHLSLKRKQKDAEDDNQRKMDALQLADSKRNRHMRNQNAVRTRLQF